MVVEDIVDTGRTMRKLLKTLEIFRPKTVKVRIDFFPHIYKESISHDLMAKHLEFLRVVCLIARGVQKETKHY